MYQSADKREPCFLPIIATPYTTLNTPKKNVVLTPLNQLQGYINSNYLGWIWEGLEMGGQQKWFFQSQQQQIIIFPVTIAEARQCPPSAAVVQLLRCSGPAIKAYVFLHNIEWQPRAAAGSSATIVDDINSSSSSEQQKPSV
ncbi:hypothetical protein OIU79_028134 [Salix purpurea]|uniref:Uncharacterized protein n=1 Tax=Salix purpurea TaxID=77065 RepID=A0A9Q0VWI4_SALPP|nr:hypothetical protein OIU79_028134 [Salix purpurea]